MKDARTAIYAQADDIFMFLGYEKTFLKISSANLIGILVIF